MRLAVALVVLTALAGTSLCAPSSYRDIKSRLQHPEAFDKFLALGYLPSEFNTEHVVLIKGSSEIRLDVRLSILVATDADASLYIVPPRNLNDHWHPLTFVCLVQTLADKKISLFGRKPSASKSSVPDDGYFGFVPQLQGTLSLSGTSISWKGQCFKVRT